MENKLKNKLNFWVVSSIVIAVILGIFLAYPLFSLLIRAFRDSGTGAATLANFVKFFSKKYYSKGLLKSFSSNSLTIEGKYSDTNYKYKFDNDEDEMEDVDVDIDGMSSVDNLLELIDWLDDFDKNEDELDLVLKLDKNGYITEITGELD